MNDANDGNDVNDVSDARQNVVAVFYEQYYDELVRWCGKMAQNLQTAEEIVQETFLRAMQSESLSVSDEKRGRAWLYRTAKNIYIDRCRHGAKECLIEDFSDEQNISIHARGWSDQNMSKEMLAVEWNNVLQLLPDLEGAIFSMRYLEGYTSKQIGEIFGMPSGTVRAKLFSARKHLRKFLSFF